jgi:hypothetical protein
MAPPESKTRMGLVLEKRKQLKQGFTLFHILKQDKGASRAPVRTLIYIPL